MKIIIEPSSAVTLAAILENKDQFASKKIALILSGGNVDLEKLTMELTLKKNRSMFIVYAKYSCRTGENTSITTESSKT